MAGEDACPKASHTSSHLICYHTVPTRHVVLYVWSRKGRLSYTCISFGTTIVTSRMMMWFRCSSIFIFEKFLYFHTGIMFTDHSGMRIARSRTSFGGRCCADLSLTLRQTNCSRHNESQDAWLEATGWASPWSYNPKVLQLRGAGMAWHRVSYLQTDSGSCSTDMEPEQSTRQEGFSSWPNRFDRTTESRVHGHGFQPSVPSSWQVVSP